MITKKQIIPIIIIFIQCFAMYSISFSQPARLISSGGPARPSGGDTSCGIVWYPAIQLSNGTYNAHSPKIAISGDEIVHATWWDGKLRLPYATSTSSGISWTVSDLITDTVQFPRKLIYNLVLAYGQSVYVFGSGGDVVPRSIIMANSTNAGLTWSEAIRIPVDSSYRVISGAILADTILITYSDSLRERRLMFSTDKGISWVRLPNVVDMPESYPQIAFTPNTLHIAGDTLIIRKELLYKRSRDLGKTWDYSEVLSTIDNHFAFERSLAASVTGTDTTVMVTWRDGKYGCLGIVGCSVLGRRSMTNGSSWTGEQILTEQPNGLEPVVALNGNVSVIAWTTEVVNFVIYHVVMRVMWNAQWSSVIDLTPGSTDAGYPAVVLSSRAVHIVWSEKIGGSTGKWCIFYRRGEFIPKIALLSPNGSERWTVGFPQTIRWNTLAVSGSVRIELSRDNGATFNEVLSDSTANGGAEKWMVTGPATPQARIRISSITDPGIADTSDANFSIIDPEEFPFAVGSGWNMMSLSMSVFDRSKSILFPGAISNAFTYSGPGYVVRDTLRYGEGFWLKFPGDTTATLLGAARERDTVQVTRGWNMVGTITDSVETGSIIQIPAGIIASPFYEFTSGRYITVTTLIPMKGYWVKVQQNGRLVLEGTTKNQEPRTKPMTND